GLCARKRPPRLPAAALCRCLACPRGDQQLPPARTLKNASMSASVPTSPSALKSALLVHGAEGQLPAMQAKKDSMSASVPVSPSQLKSAEPQLLTQDMVSTPLPNWP